MLQGPRELARDIYNKFIVVLNNEFVGKVEGDEITADKIKIKAISILQGMIPEDSMKFSEYLNVEIQEKTPGNYRFIPKNLFTGLLMSFVPFTIAKDYIDKVSCELENIKYEMREDGILITYPKDIFEKKEVIKNDR